MWRLCERADPGQAWPQEAPPPPGPCSLSSQAGGLFPPSPPAAFSWAWELHGPQPCEPTLATTAEAPTTAEAQTCPVAHSSSAPEPLTPALHLPRSCSWPDSGVDGPLPLQEELPWPEQVTASMAPCLSLEQQQLLCCQLLPNTEICCRPPAQGAQASSSALSPALSAPPAQATSLQHGAPYDSPSGKPPGVTCGLSGISCVELKAVNHCHFQGNSTCLWLEPSSSSVGPRTPSCRWGGSGSRSPCRPAGDYQASEGTE